MLCPLKGRVVSGNISALKIVAQAATALGALKASMLAVAGAFHTDLMASASEALQKVYYKLGTMTMNLQLQMIAR
jgi:malonyl CoA-acyl carrier protein transacylase